MDATSEATLRAAGEPSFLDELRALAAGTGHQPWPHADETVLIGLERWGRALAERDLRAGVRALAAAGQHGLPQAVAAGGDDIAGMGFTSDDPTDDGATVDVQLALAAAQARAGTVDHDAIAGAFDPARQLHTWSEDLLPPDDAAFNWYYEVGQCALAALRDDDGADVDDANESYYYWSRPVAVGRGLVAAARGLRMPAMDIDEIVLALGAAIAAAV
ncbi:MAG: hypothetical protein K8W52_19770 [Deltaproteobacteria bacterium]|nr:hypothetical protein [Deltaproteobacteria bacterium]